MASRRPLTINGGERELLQPNDSLDIGGYTLPNAAGNAGDYLVMGAANAAWFDRTPSKTLTISPSGADYTTIQAALDDNTAGGELFLVYPGTYTDDTIAFTASNQDVVGAHHLIHVTTANDNIVDYGNYDDCIISKLELSVTACSGTDAVVTGSGSLQVHECDISMVAIRASAGTQPACFSGSGTAFIHTGTLSYTHHGAIGAAAPSIKAAIRLLPGALYHLKAVGCDITTSNSANTVTFAHGPGVTTFHLAECEIDIEDSEAYTVTGIFVEDSGDYELAYNHLHIKTTGDAQIGAAIDVNGSATVRSMFNQIHVEDNAHVDSRSYSFLQSDGAITSQLDDIVAADEISTSGGTISFCSSEADGHFTVDVLHGTTVLATNVNTTNVNASGNIEVDVVNATTINASEDIRIVSDTYQLELGATAGGDYQIRYDGDNAVHTIVVTEAFEFDGGAIRLPVVTTAERDALDSTDNGMILYNSDEDFFQLQESGAWVQKASVIVDATNLYVKTSGNDTTGDGSDGTPWLTIDKALAYLAGFVLLAEVVIYIEKGSYGATDMLYIDHPDSAKVSIVGDYFTEVATLSASSGSNGSYSMTFDTVNTSEYTVDDYVVIWTAVNGTNPNNALGTHKVDSIDPGVSITVNSTNLTGVATDAVDATIVVPQVKWVRRITILESLKLCRGIQMVVVAPSIDSQMVRIRPDIPLKAKFDYCIIVNTSGSQQGWGFLVDYGSGLEVRFCGGANLKYWQYASNQSYSVSYSNICSNCFVAFAVYNKGYMFIASPVTIDSNYGYFVDYMSNISRGPAAIFINSLTADSSPALGAEGNHNSFVQA